MVKLARLPLPFQARWERNLFVHFRVPPSAVRGELPSGLELDLFEGDAWVSAIARMVRGPLPLPQTAIALTRPHAELLLYTHVVHDGEPGQYFFAYTFPSQTLAFLARSLFAMPFLAARLRYSESPDGELRLRVHRSTVLGEIALRARPLRAPLAVRRSPRATFLLERYAAFGGGRGGHGLQRVRFEHPEWSAVEAQVSEWNIPYLARFDLPWGGTPDAVYIAAGLPVRFRDLHTS